MTWELASGLHEHTSFKYIANTIGVKTEPCLTPNLTANVQEKMWFHFALDT